MHRLTRLIDHKMGQGKQLQAVLLLVLQKLLTPTPAMGFILGSMVTLFLAPFVVQQLGWAIAALIFGWAIAICAAVFQKIHDRYWENHND